MKGNNTFTHFCIDVFACNYETGEYEDWFTQSFATKKLAECWANGFRHANAPVKINGRICTSFKMSNIYRRYRNYKPNIG